MKPFQHRDNFRRRRQVLADEFQLRRRAMLAQLAATDAAVAEIEAELGTAAYLDVDTDPTMATDSDDLVPSQAAVAAYVASVVANYQALDATLTALSGLTPYGLTAYMGAPWLAGLSSVKTSAGAVTTEVMVGSVLIPGNTMGANGQVECFVLFSNNNSANSKNFRIRWHTSAAVGGTVIQNPSNTTNVFWGGLVIIGNTNATNSQSFRAGVSFGGAGTTPVGSAALDTTADTYLVFTVQKASSGDTASIEQYSAKVLHAA